MIGIVQFQAWICFGQPSTESTKKSKRLALKRKKSGGFSTLCELERSGSNMHRAVLFVPMEHTETLQIVALLLK